MAGPDKHPVFWRGTPSILSVSEIEAFITQAAQLFNLDPQAEITLEANPDDLTAEKMQKLAGSSVNRLSVGIQSFDAGELRWMNRAHTPVEALECLEATARLFPNYSLDLIYGIPGSTMELWADNLKQALEFKPPHISAYALTVEPRTALSSFIAKGRSPDVDEGQAQEQFEHLVQTLTGEGYDHYEISNFARPGLYSPIIQPTGRGKLIWESAPQPILLTGSKDGGTPPTIPFISGLWTRVRSRQNLKFSPPGIATTRP